jgi:hypothetical protein
LNEICLVKLNTLRIYYQLIFHWVSWQILHLQTTGHDKNDQCSSSSTDKMRVGPSYKIMQSKSFLKKTSNERIKITINSDQSSTKFKSENWANTDLPMY